MTNGDLELQAKATIPKWAAKALFAAAISGALGGGILAGLHGFGSVEGIENTVCANRAREAVRTALEQWEKEYSESSALQSAKGLWLIPEDQ